MHITKDIFLTVDGAYALRTQVERKLEYAPEDYDKMLAEAAARIWPEESGGLTVVLRLLDGKEEVICKLLETHWEWQEREVH